MNLQEIKEILQKGESVTTEFKSRLSSDKNLAIILSSFSNSFGGILLIGISSKAKVIGVTNPQKIIDKVHRVSNDLIIPKLSVATQTLDIYNKQVVIVEIPKSDFAPHSVQDSYYIRKGAFSSIASPEIIKKIIYNKADTSDNSVVVLKTQIDQLLIQNNKLFEKFTYSQSWKSKFIDLTIGAIIGGIISILFQMII